MTPVRLSQATLDQALARPQVSGPVVDPTAVTVGIVHLGIGAFHRAHQAVFTEDAAAATGETGWGILGVTQRSASVVDQLAPQDGLYGVLTKGADSSSLRIIGSLRGVAYPGTDTSLVLATLAAAMTHVVTLTVTEKGYRADGDGALDLSDDDVRADLAALVSQMRGAGETSDLAAGRSPIGLLVRGLALRQAAGGPPITVMTCDNMVDNGHVVQALVGQFVEAGAVLSAQGDPADSAAELERWADLRTWLAESVTFPCTMVDRIVPATTEAHRAEAQALTGLRDDGLVVAEPFMQWVIEDSFAGPRPAWERAGATLTSDVAPYEQAKLRMLNGTHSMLAYLGALKGHRLIADAVTDPELEAVARTLLLDDVIPTLQAPPGLDLAAYAESLIERFANPSTGHTTIQVAMDGSKKLPFRLLGTVADALAAGRVPLGAATAVAAWIAFVTRGATLSGEPLILDDPMADDLRAAATRAGSDPDALVEEFFALDAVFPPAIATHPAFRTAVAAALTPLLAPA
ncbi:fructuronate reductase [Sanguibacter gelidistatuariae]|uniref:Mannitol-1-phosphate 5-dehydrogenase n=1 Tax=Sanguibacter gelidistatuariae TaxID=1814289 RepID=A0A1G6UL40_9MICO|nr:mannitol dehydrogenase family protein [Sanguibacter gelidistatuariae]SDD41991.1 fructuronate reductase [Sanguibacter gelidistatuariae]